MNRRRTFGQTIERQLQLFFPGDRDARRYRVNECLEQVALPARSAASYPEHLSGGERQRVAIARALAAQPTLLICDEITSALDVSVQAAIIDLLRELRADVGLSILFITHNLPLVRAVADRIAIMNQGRVVESGPVPDVLVAARARRRRR